MVFNHADGSSPMVRLDRRGTGGIFLNPSQGDVFGMPQLHWQTAEMRDFFLDCALFWIEQYGIDGFRMDLVDWMDYQGYRWWRNSIKARHPDFFIIGEDFRYPADGNSVTSVGMDAQWGGQHTDQWGCPVGGACPNSFQGVVMAILEEDPYMPRWDAGVGVGCFETSCNPMWALANVLEWTSGYPAFHNEIKYIVSHDERRLSWEVERQGSPEAALIGGVTKGKLGAATLLTAVGIPMIYCGEEVGADNEVFQDPTPNKIDWNSGSPELRSYYRSMINLRLTHPTLAGGGIDFHCPRWGVGSSECQEDKTLCYWRYLGTPDQADVVVASNFDHDDHEFDVPFPSSGTWYRYDPDAGSIPVIVESDTLTVTLQASTAYIYLSDGSYIP
jgi:1,4-alpha-glucan branching enzyme